MKNIKHRNNILSNARIIILGYFIVILAGTILLTLPFSSTSAKITPFGDALFTAVSSVCVTGLVVRDTATYWSIFGQAVVLLLIQIGGMGVMTLTVYILVFSKRKIGLAQRSIMQDSISAPYLQGIVKFTKFIISSSIMIELIGAAALTPVFCRDFGFIKGIGYSVFHSVTAFCNAGFDLMGINEPFSSLTAYADNLYLNIIISVLIIAGGIGFLTWQDIKVHKHNIKKYRMQSKVILVTYSFLLIMPFLFFFFFEFEGLSFMQRITYSLFQAVTPRTAGFNTVNFSELSGAGKTITLILMLIGGAPGSTAGGMKVTTVAVLVLSAFAVFKHNKNPQCFGRRIENDIVQTSAAILFIYFVLFTSGGIAISMIENLPITDCLFETASAIGTVGLSLGLTPTLGTASRIILIVLMFFGRVGGLTIIFAAFSGTSKRVSRYPAEKITVG